MGASSVAKSNLSQPETRSDMDVWYFSSISHSHLYAFEKNQLFNLLSRCSSDYADIAPLPTLPTFSYTRHLLIFRWLWISPPSVANFTDCNKQKVKNLLVQQRNQRHRAAGFLPFLCRDDSKKSTIKCLCPKVARVYVFAQGQNILDLTIVCSVSTPDIGSTSWLATLGMSLTSNTNSFQTGICYSSWTSGFKPRMAAICVLVKLSLILPPIRGSLVRMMGDTVHSAFHLMFLLSPVVTCAVFHALSMLPSLKPDSTSAWDPLARLAHTVC